MAICWDEHKVVSIRDIPSFPILKRHLFLICLLKYVQGDRVHNSVQYSFLILIYRMNIAIRSKGKTQFFTKRTNFPIHFFYFFGISTFYMT